MILAINGAMIADFIDPNSALNIAVTELTPMDYVLRKYKYKTAVKPLGGRHSPRYCPYPARVP